MCLCSWGLSVFSSCNIFIARFWYQGNDGLVNWVKKCSLLLFLGILCVDFILFLFLKRFYLFIGDTQKEREREAETQAEGEAGSTQGARCGTRSWDSRITPWAEDRRLTADQPRDPPCSAFLSVISLLSWKAKKQNLRATDNYTVYIKCIIC